MPLRVTHPSPPQLRKEKSQFNTIINRSHRSLARVELSDEQIRAQAPSVFAAAPQAGVSERYTFLPTAQIISRMTIKVFRWVLLARLCLRAWPHPLLRRAHYRDPSDIVRQISAWARLAPVTPPAFPLRSWKSQARKEDVCRFAGEHDAGGFAAAREARRTSRVNQPSLAACNAVGCSPGKTAFRVACLKRQRAP